MQYRRLWIGLAAVIVISFAVLIYFGTEIYQKAPPIPNRVVTTAGTVLYTRQDILNGQNVWQSMGGQEVGTVWGHGAYVAPDWSADLLHREATFMLDRWATQQNGRAFAALDEPAQDALKARLREDLRTNTYDPRTGDITISPVRADASVFVADHYTRLFMDDPALQKLRDAYAIKANTITDLARMREMNAFFWWAAWACSTNRPGMAITYTNNWPSEPLINNVPSGQIVVWSVISFVLLLAGVGGLAWYFAYQRRSEAHEVHEFPRADPLLALHPTPSMQATLKYFWVVAALILVQIAMGVLTAHYGVEGSGFYGFPLAKFLPYSVTRTWHTQLGIFWIATAWLATGLFVAPAVSGYEPKLQKLGVNLLFIALLIIVVGSMVGEWMGVMQKMGFVPNFWFGEQGLEYVDLGRFWQIFLFIGLFIWLGLMTRALWPALTSRRLSVAADLMGGTIIGAKGGSAVLEPPVETQTAAGVDVPVATGVQPTETPRNAPDGRMGGEGNEERQLLGLFLLSALAIAAFYGAGLAWGRHTNYSVIEYWRWWVVHLWVEGFFEVFATTVIAFLFTRMGLLRTATASAAVLFSTIIFLAGGIIGTFHHLYFTGTPTAVMAFGAVFSALEVVPLVLVGFEGYENLTLTRVRPWVQAYRWPILFFVAVAFWNMVGAGLFGFLINPPIALYYMQGLNTTPVHGHTALFGVYGMLGMGLMLFCLKGLTGRRVWNTKVLAFAFWAINIGLGLMVLISMLPVGLLQTWASVEHGMWYARSAEFMQTPLMNTLRWMRVIGDTTFALGAFALCWFVLGLKTGWSLRSEDYDVLDQLARVPQDERELVQ